MSRASMVEDEYSDEDKVDYLDVDVGNDRSSHNPISRPLTPKRDRSTKFKPLFQQKRNKGDVSFFASLIENLMS